MPARAPRRRPPINQTFPVWNTLCQRPDCFSLQVESYMKNRLVAVTWIILFPAAFAARGQSPAPQRALMDKYCIGCHNQRGSNGLALDAKSIDLEHVASQAEKFERVIRKL